MAVRLQHKPRLESPILVASWPGIGNVGLIAVDTLRGILRAEVFGEVERGIEEFYRQIPVEIRTQLDRLKGVTYAQTAKPGPITDEEKGSIMEEVERFFKTRGDGD